MARMGKRGQPKKARMRQRPIGPVKTKTNQLQLTPYRYKFQLQAQLLTGDATAGSMVLSPTGGLKPIQGPPATSAFTLFPSSNGLSNFYDLAIACPFRLRDLNYAANFQQMYDAYKFGKVTLNVSYLNNVSAVNATGLMPTIYMVWDQDDALVPPSLTSISGKQGVKVRQFGDGAKTTQRISVVPVTAGFVQATSGTANALVSNKPQWLDCVNDDVVHYGIKLFITDLYLPGSTAVTQALRFNWTYHVSFRAPLLTA